MANALKRLTMLEKAVEQLLARDKVYLLVRAGDTAGAAEKRAIADGSSLLYMQQNSWNISRY
jgi:hypothetical protein